MISASKQARFAGRFLAKRKSLFFTPAAEMGNLFDESEALRRDAEAAEKVPDRPVFPVKERIFREIIKPEDACTPFFRPTSTDMIVTALAKECPISGRPDYQMVSKSLISGSKMGFANTAISWMESKAFNVAELKLMADASEQFRYSETKRQEKLDKLYTSDVWATEPLQVKLLDGTVKQMTALEAFYRTASLQAVNHENVSAFLLTKAETDFQLKMLFESFKNAGSVLTLLPYFASKVVEKIYSSPSAENIQLFGDYLRDRETNSIATSQALLLELETVTIDKIIYLASILAQSASEMTIAKEALIILMEKLKTAPLTESFNAFLGSLFQHADAENLTRESLLHQLMPVKDALHVVHLEPETISSILKMLITNTFDLTHFLQIISKTSPTFFKTHLNLVISRLIQLQKNENTSSIVSQVQISQTARLMMQSGLEKTNCEQIIKSASK